MSVIQLSANHVYAVAMGVTKLLNNVPAVNYVFLKDNTCDALNAAFKDCKGESTMLKEIRNNVYNALFVAADEEGQRYAAFEGDFNGEFWEATACTESGELVKGETVRLFPVLEHDEEADTWETIGYEIR